MTYSLSEVKERIPLYLNNRLSEKERKEFEEALKRYPELKVEFQEFSEINQIYREIGRDLALPSDPLYHRVLKNVQPQIKLSLTLPEKRYSERVREFLKWVFGSRRVSWGVVAVQFAILLILLITLSRGDGFRTLTSTLPPTEQGIKINVIFDEGSREKEIREVLNAVGATIVQGPSPEGLYVIKVKGNKDLSQTLKDLKKSRIVRFAETAY